MLKLAEPLPFPLFLTVPSSQTWCRVSLFPFWSSKARFLNQSWPGQSKDQEGTTGTTGPGEKKERPPFICTHTPIEHCQVPPSSHKKAHSEDPVLYGVLSSHFAFRGPNRRPSATHYRNFDANTRRPLYALVLSFPHISLFVSCRFALSLPPSPLLEPPFPFSPPSVPDALVAPLSLFLFTRFLLHYSLFIILLSTEYSPLSLSNSPFDFRHFDF